MISRKSVVAFCVFLVLTISVFSGVNSAEINSPNPYGGPCSIAEGNGYTNPGWNALCYSYMEVIDECCASGACGSWFCDNL